MADECKARSDLPEVAKLNGEFRKTYGKLLGAFLYLRSISAARGRSWFWTALVSTACLAGRPGLGSEFYSEQPGDIFLSNVNCLVRKGVSSARAQMGARSMQLTPTQALSM